MRAPARLATPILAAVALAMAAGACNQSRAIQTQALADSQPVTFRSIDGVSLAGRLFGPEAATAGVVLAHMLPSDQRSWYPFADRLGGLGYRVLTFDFRGYCPGGDGGCSKGRKDIARSYQDVAGAVAFLQTQGVRRIGLVGASMGGTASLVVAASDSQIVRAVVTLSAPQSIGGLTARPDMLQTATAAKLFIAGNGDGAAADDAQAFYQEAQPPKRVEILTTADHGTDILEGSQSEVATNLITGWLGRYLPVR